MHLCAIVQTAYVVLSIVFYFFKSRAYLNYVVLIMYFSNMVMSTSAGFTLLADVFVNIAVLTLIFNSVFDIDCLFL